MKNFLPIFSGIKERRSGMLLSGELEIVYKDKTRSLEPGDTIYLKTTNPEKWQNVTDKNATPLWIKIK